MRYPRCNGHISWKIQITEIESRINRKLHRFVTWRETELAIKKVPTKKSFSPNGFTGQLYQIFKEGLSQMLQKYF